MRHPEYWVEEMAGGRLPQPIFSQDDKGWVGWEETRVGRFIQLPSPLRAMKNRQRSSSVRARAPGFHACLESGRPWTLKLVPHFAWV